MQYLGGKSLIAKRIAPIVNAARDGWDPPEALTEPEWRAARDLPDSGGQVRGAKHTDRLFRVAA